MAVVGRGRKWIAEDVPGSPGTFRCTFTIHDQHYEDEQGNWQVVDESLVDDGADGFDKKCDKTAHTFRISSGGNRRWYPRRNVTTEYVSITGMEYFQGTWRNLNLPAAVWKTDGAEWDMANLYASVTNTWHRIKTDFILKDATAPTGLRFAITFVGLTYDSVTGKLYSGELHVGTINTPFAVDATGADVIVSSSYDGTYVSWLVDTTGATFPIDVDPTFTDGYGGDVNTAAETAIVSGSPTTNYGTSNQIEYYSTTYRSLWKFDISSLPGGATISAATLYLYKYAVNSGNYSLLFHNIINSLNTWYESEATWNQPNNITTWWQGDTGMDGGADAGCSVSGTDYSSTAICTFSFPSGGSIGDEMTGSLDLTELENWRTVANIGMVSWSPNAATQRVCTSDHATTAYRPKLVITYSTATAVDLVPSDAYVVSAADTVVVATDCEYLRPSSDVTDGLWTNESGNNTNLYASIDEGYVSDSDYIQSQPNPSNSAVVVKLSTGVDPTSSANHIVRYRYAKLVGSPTANLTVQLRQGYVSEGSLGTLIAEWTHSDISSTLTNAAQTLTSGQADSITDYSDLYLRMVAS